jgi:putative phage-type endonuclease
MSVTKDREKWIGGSDVPAVMGISPFKTRYDLLLEKAGLKEVEFVDNEYVRFGRMIEPKIRAYINDFLETTFKPNKKTEGKIRYHSDGVNETTMIEIKSTSQIHQEVNDYKIYLVQLLTGMKVNKLENGILAVYERPADFSEEFDPARLQIFYIKISDYQDLMKEIELAVDGFIRDVEKLQQDPFLTEQDLLATDENKNEIVELSNQVLAFENQLKAYKELENQYKELKEKLFAAMYENSVKKWTTNSGVQITMVEPIESTTTIVSEFDEKTFEKENKELYNKYLVEKEETKSGKKGYVRITLPKE